VIFTDSRRFGDASRNRYGGRRSGSRLRHPFTGMAKVRPWFVGFSDTKSKDDGAEAEDHESDSLERAGGRKATERALTGWCRLGVPTSDTRNVRGRWIRGEGSLSGNNAQRVSVTSVERRSSSGSSQLVKESGFGRWKRSRDRFTGKRDTHRGPSYRSWRRLTTSPILHDPHDANHAGST